jgi:3-deoxy-D-arabino-heptulosonate 7-phosphate (DAHP) synthase class II
VQAAGVDHTTIGMTTTEFYTAHEALLLDYEQALTRLDSTSGLFYDCSAHFVWCGERTRQLDKAHVEFLRGVANPIGVKMSNKSDPNDLVQLCSMLNPANTPGRLSVIIRMGARNVREHLPKLIQAMTDAGLVVTWVCDPVHGNTETVNGYKTRRYDNIRAEVEAFFDVHEQMGTVPGGVHLEMTGDDVTECIGGARPPAPLLASICLPCIIVRVCAAFLSRCPRTLCTRCDYNRVPSVAARSCCARLPHQCSLRAGGSSVSETDLSSRYHTHCDPRLNAEQALEMAFYVGSRLRERHPLGDGSRPGLNGTSRT